MLAAGWLFIGPLLRFADGLDMKNSKACAVQTAQAEEIQTNMIETARQYDRDIASRLKGARTATSIVVHVEPCMVEDATTVTHSQQTHSTRKLS